MDIGLNIADGVRVRLGDSIEFILQSLDKSKVEYVIPYQKQSGSDMDMVIYMEKCGVELNITNGIITYIKSNNTKSNYVMQLENGQSPVEVLYVIKNKLASSFNLEDKSIRIDKFDSKNFNTTLSIPVTSSLKAKIDLIIGESRKVFMRSIQLSS